MLRKRASERCPEIETGIHGELCSRVTFLDVKLLTARHPIPCFSITNDAEKILILKRISPAEKNMFF